MYMTLMNELYQYGLAKQLFQTAESLLLSVGVNKQQGGEAKKFTATRSQYRIINLSYSYLAR